MIVRRGLSAFCGDQRSLASWAEEIPLDRLLAGHFARPMFAEGLDNPLGLAVAAGNSNLLAIDPSADIVT